MAITDDEEEQLRRLACRVVESAQTAVPRDRFEQLLLGVFIGGMVERRSADGELEAALPPEDVDEARALAAEYRRLYTAHAQQL